MIILLLFALSLSIPTSSNVLNNTSNFSRLFQKKCEEHLPYSPQSSASLAALICGVKLPHSSEQKNLLRTSLIHAYVVSGAHLILIDQFFGILKIPGFVRIFFLGFYSLLVGWQPPVVRALFGWGLKSTRKRLRVHLPPDLLVALAGMTCLILFPAWWQSMSLILSWCASLALCLPSVLGTQKGFSRILISQLCLFVLMSVPLWGWGNLHPLSVVFNIALLPYISFVLLPLGWGALLFPPLLSLFEKCEAFFHWILSHGAEPIVLTQASSFSVASNWLWILFWQVFVHFLRLRGRQGQDRLGENPRKGTR